MIKLEIGPGPNKIDSTWTTVGPYEAPHIDHIAKWGFDKLPFADNSIDLIYASHVLEHVWWYQVEDALKETYRILVQNGKLELHVPDFSVIVSNYLKGTCGDSWRKYNDDDSYMTWVNGRVFTYGGPGNTHRAVFDRKFLHKHLVKAGFKNIVLGAPIRGHNHGPIDLAMTAYKEK